MYLEVRFIKNSLDGIRRVFLFHGAILILLYEDIGSPGEMTQLVRHLTYGDLSSVSKAHMKR